MQQTLTPPPEPYIEPPRPSTPPRRKLSKTPKHSSRKEVPSPEKVEKRNSAAVPSPLPADVPGPSRYHSHREHATRTEPSTQTRESASRHGSSADASSRRKSVAQDGKLHKRSRDGVKPLTDRQMEKLSHRMSYSGSSPSKEQIVQQSRRSMVEEQPPSRSVIHHQPSYRSNQGSSRPFPTPMQEQHTQQSPQPPKQPQQHAHHAPSTHMPLPQTPEQPPQASTSAQLPTPPDDCIPIPRHRREQSPSKAKRMSPQRVEELEIFAGHGTRGDSARPHSDTPSELPYYPLLAHLSEPVLLENLLAYLSYYEWLTLTSVSKDTRRVLYEDGREQVLSRYLHIVGYSKWVWKDPEPLILTVEVRFSTIRAYYLLIERLRISATTCVVSRCRRTAIARLPRVGSGIKHRSRHVSCKNSRSRAAPSRASFSVSARRLRPKRHTMLA